MSTHKPPTGRIELALIPAQFAHSWSRGNFLQLQHAVKHLDLSQTTACLLLLTPTSFPLKHMAYLVNSSTLAHICTWRLSAERKVGVPYSRRLTYWIMESCSWSASGQSQWHTGIGMYTHTQLGQHRCVLGKQAAAGGRMDHKAGLLAKFHHLLWIAWEAHSSATGGMFLNHMQSQICILHADTKPFWNERMHFIVLHFILCCFIKEVYYIVMGKWIANQKEMTGYKTVIKCYHYNHNG